MKVVRHAASALVGAALAAVVVFGAASLGNEEPPRVPELNVSPTERVEVELEKRGDASALLLAWVPTGTGGLPDDTQRLLEDTRGVRAVAISTASLDWLTSSTAPDGARLDDPPRGMRIPIEIVAIDPAQYADMAPPSDRAAIQGLGAGEVLLSETGVTLRGDPATITLESGRYEVAGVISDAGANGYEMVVSTPPPTSWDIVDRFALVDARSDKARARVRQTLNENLGPGQVLRIRAQGETPYLRYGDAVVPQSIIKENFGEFAARPLPDGTLVMDESFMGPRIHRDRVPILGEVVCHRALFPQWRQALREIRRKGLSDLIDTSQYGGCFGPRFIGRIPGGRLSHHAWGIAIDLNAADNAFGTRPDLDPRLVKIMEDYGFTWGGRWLVPDGMHFEWVRFP